MNSVIAVQTILSRNCTLRSGLYTSGSTPIRGRMSVKNRTFSLIIYLKMEATRGLIAIRVYVQSTVIKMVLRFPKK